MAGCWTKCMVEKNQCSKLEVLRQFYLQFKKWWNKLKQQILGLKFNFYVKISTMLSGTNGKRISCSGGKTLLSQLASNMPIRDSHIGKQIHSSYLQTGDLSFSLDQCLLLSLQKGGTFQRFLRSQPQSLQKRR